MIKLMTHMIPYFPDRETSIEIAKALVAGGADYLEIQFAFSDPGADGPVIEAACQTALSQGFTVEGGFQFIESIRASEPSLKSGQTKIFIMTYASIAYTFGIENFCARAAKAGASGLIVPDLPLDSDEGLGEAAKKKGLVVVPVLAANAQEPRITLAQNSGAEYIYCALRTGITGVQTKLGEQNLKFLAKVGATGAKILAGFGITRGDQVKALDGNAHAAVVGSALLRSITQGFEGKTGILGLKALMNDLSPID